MAIKILKNIQLGKRAMDWWDCKRIIKKQDV